MTSKAWSPISRTRIFRPTLAPQRACLPTAATLSRERGPKNVPCSMSGTAVHCHWNVWSDRPDGAARRVSCARGKDATVRAGPPARRESAAVRKTTAVGMAVGSELGTGSGHGQTIPQNPREKRPRTVRVARKMSLGGEAVSYLMLASVSTDGYGRPQNLKVTQTDAPQSACPLIARCLLQLPTANCL